MSKKQPKLIKLVQAYSPNARDVWSYLSNPKALSISLLNEAIRILKMELSILRDKGDKVYLALRK